MRSLLPALLLILLAPLGSHADEAATAPLDTWAQVWRPGDIATMHQEETRHTEFTITTKDAQSGEDASQTVLGLQHVSYTLVTRCLTVNAKGKLASFVAYLKDWALTTAQAATEEELKPEPDTSLTGVLLQVTRTATAHEYKVLTPGLTLTPGASAWLDEEVGAGAKDDKGVDFDKLGRPAGPVKVGASWAGDPAKLDMPFKFDPKASSATLKLEALEDGAFTVPIEVRLKLSEFSFGEGNPPLPFTEGGVMAMNMKLRQSLAPGTFDGEASMEMELKGTAAIPGAVSVALSIEIEMSGKASTGGEMPALPTQPAPK